MRGEHGASMGRYDVVTDVGSCFLQMFLCDRFPTFAPKPVGFPTVIDLQVSNGLRGIRCLNTYKP